MWIDRYKWMAPVESICLYGFYPSFQVNMCYAVDLNGAMHVIDKDKDQIEVTNERVRVIDAEKSTFNINMLIYM